MKSTLALCVSYATACLAYGTLTADKVEADISKAEIAESHGGNRAFGHPGYDASAEFILERAGRHALQLTTSVQHFNHTFHHTREIRLSGSDGEDVPVRSMEFNHATPVPEGISAPLVMPPLQKNLSSCHAWAWADVKATGKIALVKGSACPALGQILQAKAVGALGVLIDYDVAAHGPEPDIELGSHSIGRVIPGGVISSKVADTWRERLATGEEVMVNLLVDSFNGDRESRNIISETKVGDANSVVLLGAHLDSVPEGPGINDNGSGVAALLRIMDSVVKYDNFTNKIRFAWWGAEEVGIGGSAHYISQLGDAGVDKIKYVFTHDMIGSAKPKYAVQTGNEPDCGSEILHGYLQRNGKPAKYEKFSFLSDHMGFLALGIPVSGIHTGNNEHHPFYHTKEDTVANINLEALWFNTKAAGRAAAALAGSLAACPKRDPRAPFFTEPDAHRRKH